MMMPKKLSSMSKELQASLWWILTPLDQSHGAIMRRKRGTNGRLMTDFLWLFLIFSELGQAWTSFQTEDHSEVISNQLNAVRNDFADCFSAVGEEIIDARARRNKELISVVSGIYLGTILQNYGTLLDDTQITAADIAGRAGFGLVRSSFTVGRVFAITRLELSCFDNVNPFSLLDSVFQDLSNVCSSSSYRSYRARAERIALNDAISCLSSGSSVGNSKLRALNSLHSTLALQQIGSNG